MLFPDWPVDVDTPNPCEFTACRLGFKCLVAITNLQGTLDQANAVSDAIQQHCSKVMNQNTISQLYACQREDEIRQVLGRLIEDLESNFGRTPITTDNLPTRPVSAMSPQPSSSTQYLQYQLLPVSQPDPFYSRGRRSQFHTPAVSSLDSNSSRFFRSHDQFDTFTESTPFSDQMPTGFNTFESLQGIDRNSDLPLFQSQMTVSVVQQSMSNITHQPGPSFATENGGVTRGDSWIGNSHDYQRQLQPGGADMLQGDLQPGDYHENEILSMSQFQASDCDNR